MTTMMKKFGMVMALGLALFVTAPSRAMAQQDDTQKIIPSLELDQADVRDALRALFRNVNVNYSIAPEVQGTVTVSLKNVLFETALQFILKQVDATYRIESGVYQIIHREAQIFNPTSPDTGTQLVPVTKVVRRLYIRYADPQFIFTMLKGSTNVNLTPEISKARNTAGGVAGGGGVGGGIGGGSGGGVGGGIGGSSGGVGGGVGGGSGGGIGGGIG